ncbi:MULTISPECIES: hypothetical protein [unclassified Spiroplasma]|uniref:hypothetical protein n=1 Tax=unclassified Spiroplasma TaxID=2637901 RepID=UPI0030D26AD4
MKNLINLFKKQNWGIKIGFASLVISLLCLALGLILIATANFKAPSGGVSQYAGNGFHVISVWGLDSFLSKAGYDQMWTDATSDKLLTYPLAQVVVGIVFTVILTAIFFGVSVLSLIFGYFKRWLYS